MFRGLFKFVVGEDPETQREAQEDDEGAATAETAGGQNQEQEQEEQEERIDVVGDMDSKADTTAGETAVTPTRRGHADHQPQVVELVRKTTESQEETEAAVKALMLAKQMQTDPAQVLVGDDGKPLQFFVPQDMQFARDLKTLISVIITLWLASL